MPEIYLEVHPPKGHQYNPSRGRSPSGAIVIHDAECNPDFTDADTAAESVASFISKRPDPGSYHSLVDSDSTVRVGRYDWEMFHEGTGGNKWSLGLSFACRTSSWTAPETGPGSRWQLGILAQGAGEAASMARWVKTTTGIDVPAKRISPQDYRSGQPGFISHGELDPKRRTDPGKDFPWGDFIALYALHMNENIQQIGIDVTPQEIDNVKTMQTKLNSWGLNPPLMIDGQLGPKTIKGLDDVLAYATGEIVRARGQLAQAQAPVQTQLDTLRTKIKAVLEGTL